MYIPRHFEEHDQERIARLIHEHSFGLLLSIDGARPYASHVPFSYEPGRLHGHLARANPQVEQLTGDRDVLAIFSGPHAYVSPTWYESAGVPTWNYAAVHIYGRPRKVTDRSQLKEHVEGLARRYEQHEAQAWQPDYNPAKLDGIVGVEIAVTEIQAKWKLSQNRLRADRANVVEALTKNASDAAGGVAELMRELESRR